MKLIKRTSALVIALIMTAALMAGCGGQSVSKEAVSALESAKTAVTEFARDQRRNGAIFTHSIFEFANEAAKKIGEDYSSDNLKKVAEEDSFDRIVVADQDKNILGSYPDDLTDKKLKQIEELKQFSAIASYNAIEMISDPVYDEESGKYAFTVGVHRADGSGVVVFDLKNDEYASVSGADLAEKCGENFVIIKDDAVLSSSLAGVKAQDAVDSLGISADDLAKGSFSIKADGKDYKCASVQAGDYYIVKAE